MAREHSLRLMPCAPEPNADRGAWSTLGRTEHLVGGSGWHMGPWSVGLVHRSPGVWLDLCGSFSPRDGGDRPLALVQIDRLSKSSLGRTATAERAQHVRKSEAGIGLQCQ
jgi:hypothetical protein